MIARLINGHLKRHRLASDRNIPKTSYMAGFTALPKMSGQEFPGLCLLTIFASHGWHDGSQISKVESDYTILLWLSISLNGNLNMGQYMTLFETFLNSFSSNLPTIKLKSFFT